MALVELAGDEDMLLAIESDLAEIEAQINERCADLMRRKMELQISRGQWLAIKQQREQALLEQMEARGLRRWENDEVLIRVRKGTQACVIDSEADVPEDFKSREWVDKVDKMRLKAHLVAHPDDSVGAHLKRGPSKLEVKWKAASWLRGNSDDD